MNDQYAPPGMWVQCWCDKKGRHHFAGRQYHPNPVLLTITHANELIVPPDGLLADLPATLAIGPNMGDPLQN